METTLFDRLRWAQYYLEKARISKDQKDKENYNLIAESQINKILKGNYEAIGSQRLRNEIYRQNILPKGF